MALPPRLGKLALTTHVTASVGWLGAVVAFLALPVAGLTSQTPRRSRGLSGDGADRRGRPRPLKPGLPGDRAGLLPGQRLGLVRHYWVLFKLVINLVATIVLVLYMQTLEHLADVAAATTLSGTGLRDPSPALHAAAALQLLLVATTLAIDKPRGLTGYGQRTQHRQPTLPLP